MKKALLGVVLFLGVGCGTEPNDAAPVDTAAPIEETGATQDGLLTRLKLDNGNVVEFYEVRPGDVLVTETSRYLSPPSNIRGMDPVDAYRALTGKREVPAVLAAAQQRLEAARAKAPAVPLQAQGPEAGMPVASEAPAPGGVQASAISASWFMQNYCLSGYDWEMCLTNWWNGAWAQINGADYHYTAVCAFSGSVVLDIQGQGIWTVPENYCRWAAKSYSNDTYRADVTSASGNGFHFAANVNY